MNELLESEQDPARRRELARRIALDALQTLPRVWAEAIFGDLRRPSGGPRAAAEAAWQDLRHSLRSFARQPIVPLVAIVSIALGIGFNVSLFSAINALLLRPTPGITEPERVVEIGRTNGGNGFDSFSYPDMLSLREGAAPLEHVAAWRVVPVSYGGGGAGERVVGMTVSAGYFEALGASPRMGRWFRPEEDVIGGPAVAVISDRFWRTWLEADPDVVGRSILLNRVPVTVVGVAAEGFGGHFPLVDTDIWLPFARLDVAEPTANPLLYDERRFISHQVIARLAEGATLEQANAAVGAVMASLAEAYPDTNEGRGAAVARLGPVPGGGSGVVKAFLGLLMVLVILILLVAAANVAGMLLARTAAREKETAIRLAIGSGRARLVRQLLVETLVLAFAGAAAGMLLAFWATSLITTIEGPGLEIVVDLTPDETVFVFAFGLAVLTGVFVGIVPALQSSRPDLLSALKLGAGATRGRGARRVFVTVQVGLSVVLLAAGALLVRSLARATQMSGGFEPEGVHLTSLDLSLDGYAIDDVASLQEELRATLAGWPGAAAAALANDLPLDLSENSTPIWPDEWPGDEGRGMGADANIVSPGYFEALRIPLLRGRDFDATDREGAPPVVLVSEALARRAWGERDPIGRTLRWGNAEGLSRTVIGVVGEVKNQWLGESEDGMVYLPLAQRPTPATHVIARGTAMDGSLLREALLEVDPQLTLSPPQTLESITAVSLLPSRLAAGLTAILGGLALFLSSLGVYGVVAHAVAQRRREIGVRLALGAGAGDVVRMAVAGGLALALPGLLVGAAAAVGVAQLLRSLLFGISVTDPLALGAVVLVLTTAVGLASWIPGRRAAAVDPLEALSAE